MDELSTVYEKAFTAARPSEQVREAVLLIGREASPSPLRFVRRLSTAAAAVLILLALLGCGAAAVVYGEGIQGFFARQWERLTGAPIHACDLRAGAAMVIAGLAAQGITEIDGIHHIERGYETLVEKLSAVGADIRSIVVPDEENQSQVG